LKESIGSAFLYNIIFLFIIVIFGFLTATINYYKAFKVNKAILNYISQYSGYNDKSKKAVDDYLTSIGYSANSEGDVCRGNKANGTLVNTGLNRNHYYCVYFHDNDNGSEGNKRNGDGKYVYYTYGVTTYIYIRLPIAGLFKIPVYTKGGRMYNFTDGQSQKTGV